MTARTLSISNAGAVTLGGSGVLTINYDLYSYLGDNVSLDVSLFGKVTNPASVTDVALRLTWRDKTNDDVIYQVQGTLATDENDYSSIANVAWATEYFKTFDMTVNGDIVAAVKASPAYNPVNGLGRAGVKLDLPADQPPAFNADSLYSILTNLDERPSHLVLNRTDNLQVYTTLLRAIDTLNVPLDIELDPTLTVDQAAAMATTLDAQDHRVQIMWSPNVARPYDAVSLKGRKKPCRAMGQYTAMKVLRNAVTTAQGIPKIGDPVSGENYPFTYKAMEPLLPLGNPELETLAKARVNVVRRINYDTGTYFVMSDVLTQYPALNSALRLVNAAEIACYTTNRCTDILKRHMLKRTDRYLAEASKDIQEFLNACVGANLLSPGEDIGNKPYAFSLTPDEQFPFERVRFYLARCPVGAVRAVIFDDDVVVK